MTDKSLRYRVNIARGMTGKMSWDCTVDGEGFLMAEILMASDKLVEELERRYPPEIPEPKKKEA